jgi:predicted nucleotidyltransferase
MDAGTISNPLIATGLSERELALVLDVLRQNGHVRRATLFGSRAKGTAQKNSDIDLAIEGLESDHDLLLLAMTLDDLPLPYRFDLQRLESLASEPLKAHIDRVGVVIYQQ